MPCINYLHKNYKLYMDSFYNSFKLCEKTKTINIFCCETMMALRLMGQSQTRQLNYAT